MLLNKKIIDGQNFLNCIKRFKNFAQIQLNSNILSLRKMMFIGVSIILLLSIGLIAFKKYKSTAPRPIHTQRATTNNLALTEEINNIDTRLAAIEQHLSENHTTNESIENISKQITNLSAQFQTLLNQSDDNMNQHFQFATTTLKEEISTVKSIVSDLSKQKTHHLLPASQLPFQVLRIDMIQEQPVVTVNYNHTTLPLMIGDELTGWKLMSTNFSKQEAHFKNFKEEWIHTQATHLTS